jgi:hypothetical protein
MTRIASSPIVILAVVLTFLGGGVIFAQDKYTVQVPGGLAFSEFRGYEDWPVPVREPIGEKQYWTGIEPASASPSGKRMTVNI